MPASVTEQNNWIATRTYDNNSSSSRYNSSLSSYYSSSTGLSETTTSSGDDSSDEYGTPVYDYDSSVYVCNISTLDFGTNEDELVSSVDDNNLLTNEDLSIELDSSGYEHSSSGYEHSLSGNVPKVK